MTQLVIKNITSVKLVVKAQYMNCMKYNTKCYRGKSKQHNNIIVLTHTLVHPCMDVMSVTKVKILKSVCSRNQARKILQSHTICLTGSDHDCILDEIKRIVILVFIVMSIS